MTDKESLEKARGLMKQAIKIIVSAENMAAVVEGATDAMGVALTSCQESIDEIEEIIDDL